MTLNRDGGSQTYKPGEIFAMPRGCVHYESYGAGRRRGAARPQALI